MKLNRAIKLFSRLISFVLILYWRFLWLIISLILTGIAAGIIANYIYAYISCKPSKQNSCKFYFSDPNTWPITLFIHSYLPQILIAITIFLAFSIIAYTVNHQSEVAQRRRSSDTPIGTLPLIRDLRPESLKLGDDYAANFPYVLTPIQNIYDEIIRVLRSARSKAHQNKRGILILGESNAGKTRLAYEALNNSLPKWPILRWKPNYQVDNNLKLQLEKYKRLVILIDDLQEYLPSSPETTQIPYEPHISALRDLLETMIQMIQKVVIVTTCRSENEAIVQATFNWLFVQLKVISIPKYSEDNQNPQAKEIITEFQKRGNMSIKKEDWDGTLGSLVLGLSTKESQYLNLSTSHHPTATILTAMKLLSQAGIVELTDQRIQAVCADVFGKADLLKNDVWRENIELLITMQFITLDKYGPDSVLVIRKDSYFKKVITNYPPNNQVNRLINDLILLKDLFEKLKDIESLLQLSMASST